MRLLIAQRQEGENLGLNYRAMAYLYRAESSGSSWTEWENACEISLRRQGPIGERKREHARQRERDRAGLRGGRWGLCVKISKEIHADDADIGLSTTQWANTCQETVIRVRQTERKRDRLEILVIAENSEKIRRKERDRRSPHDMDSHSFWPTMTPSKSI